MKQADGEAEVRRKLLLNLSDLVEYNGNRRWVAYKKNKKNQKIPISR